jgi:hypothetical protein
MIAGMNATMLSGRLSCFTIVRVLAVLANVFF